MKLRLRRLLLDNLSLKIIALVLTLALFLMVRSERQSLAQGTVRLAVSIPEGKYLATEPPSQLRVSVQGPASRMQRFRFEDLPPMQIDLREVRGGYFKFSEDLVSLPAGLRVTAIRPAGFTVRYEQRTTRSALVKVSLLGQVAKGYQVVRTEVRPSRVRLSGPHQAVRAINEVSTQHVSVEGATTSLVQRVDLASLPAKVSASPARKLEVRVHVTPLVSRVLLSRVPVLLEIPGGRAGEADPASVNITVTGPAQVLAGLSMDRVTARVRPPADARGTVVMSPSIEGLPAEARVEQVSPPTVRLTLLGEEAPTGTGDSQGGGRQGKLP